ncbi:MAG: tRNA (5-methylaminomethyl-2-thiouridine)(34)-methyltransferase MnmD [Bacteroidales bacterium]
MRREIKITGDGSHTLYVHELDEPYHSIHSSIQESRHVYIEEGYKKVNIDPIRILECGFGTGLNLLLTLEEATRSGKSIYYHTVEKYPLTPDEYRLLNFESFLSGIPHQSLFSIHQGPWDQPFMLGDHFTVYKERADFRKMVPKGPFDLVYFDAFAPDKQPELWNEAVFSRIYKVLNPGAILVTYTSKGAVRRTLTSCGYSIEKVPGPPGKREMIRAGKR